MNAWEFQNQNLIMMMSTSSDVEQITQTCKGNECKILAEICVIQMDHLMMRLDESPITRASTLFA